MSSDVQPRKRKDKRRRKDDEDSGTPPPTLINPSDTSIENVTIHIYKESSTGGHWCARIIFFVLLAALVGLIGIIIFEHRGTTDVDTPIASSRWASIFDGWVDDVPPSYIDVSQSQKEIHETSKEVSEEEQEEQEDEESTEVEQKVEEEDIEQSTNENEEVSEEEEEEREEYDKEVENDEEEETNERQEQVEGESEEESEEIINENEEDDTEEDEDIDEKELSEEYNIQQGFDDANILEEVDDTNEQEDADEENNILDNFDMEFDTSKEIIDNSLGDQDNDASEEFNGIRDINEIEDNNEPLEEIESEESIEDINDANDEEEAEEIEEETSSVAVKFGVGVALVIAAHLVLVRRWNNVETGISPTSHDITNVPDLSRRNTIVPPPHVRQVVKSAENLENKIRVEAQAENYEDLRSKYNKLQEESISLTEIQKIVLPDETAQIKKKDTWQTSSTFKEEISAAQDQSKIVSSEEEIEDEEYDESEDERISGAEEYEEKRKDESEAEEEEEDGDDDYDEELESIDDSELIAKLEAKYGRLPTPQDSEEEEEEDNDDDNDDDDDDDDDDNYEQEKESKNKGEKVEYDEIPKWKRAKENEEYMKSQTKKSFQETEIKINQADIRQSRSRGKTYDFSDISNLEDAIVYEENNSIPQVDREFHK